MVAEFFDTGIQKLIPDMTNASIQAVTMLWSSLSMYLFLYYNKTLFHIACFFNISLEITFRITLILLGCSSKSNYMLCKLYNNKHNCCGPTGLNYLVRTPIK
jgi:hypothetical protein